MLIGIIGAMECEINGVKECMKLKDILGVSISTIKSISNCCIESTKDIIGFCELGST